MANELPSDEIMRELTKIAIEKVTQSMAAKAREFALTLPFEITGREALRAFADSIDSTNERFYPKGEKQ